MNFGWFRPEFFYLLIYKPSYCNFLESRKKNLIFFILSADSKFFLFVEKNNIFLRVCLCIFKSDTVKSDFPDQIFWKKIFKDLIQTVVGLPITSFTVSGDMKKKTGNIKKKKKKKKALKMTS